MTLLIGAVVTCNINDHMHTHNHQWPLQHLASKPKICNIMIVFHKMPPIATIMVATHTNHLSQVLGVVGRENDAANDMFVMVTIEGNSFIAVGHMCCGCVRLQKIKGWLVCQSMCQLGYLLYAKAMVSSWYQAELLVCYGPMADAINQEVSVVRIMTLTEWI